MSQNTNQEDYIIVDEVQGDEQPAKEPRKGQYKTREKFIEFVGGKGNVNFLTDEAIVEAKYLSGSINPKIKFKLTLCDEGTVDFDEIDTTETTTDERGRLLDLLMDKSLVPSRIKNHFIISEVPFTATKQINGKDINVYLAVEYQTPIAKLASIFDDEEEVTINTDQDSKLDQLLSLFDDEPVVETEVETISEVEEPRVDIEVKSESQKRLEESFNKMKQDKIEELQKKIEHQKIELNRYRNEKTSAERKISEAEDDIKLLESRLDTLKPNDEPNGYIFFVSEELNQKVNLPEDIEALIREKVSKVRGINAEGFMKLFEGGEYQIRLAKIESEQLVEVTDYENLPEEIKDKLDFIHLHDGKLIHHGDLKWHDLVQKMIKLGFEQSSEFDKMCGSNSFGSKDGDTNTYQPRVKTFEQFGQDLDQDSDEDEDSDIDPNDDFIFGITVDPNAPADEPSVFVSVSPKAYFDQEGYAYDQHLESALRKKYPLLKSLGDSLEELQEGTFVVGDGTGYLYHNLNQTVDIFCKAGLLAHTDYQKFLDSCSGRNDLVNFQNSVTSQGHKLY